MLSVVDESTRECRAIEAVASLDIEGCDPDAIATHAAVRQACVHTIGQRRRTHCYRGHALAAGCCNRSGLHRARQSESVIVHLTAHPGFGSVKKRGLCDSGDLGAHSNNLESCMADNRYSYNGHTNPQPVDLFFWVAADQLCKRFGFSDLAAAAGILLGQNDVPVPGKRRGCRHVCRVDGRSQTFAVQYRYAAADNHEGWCRRIANCDDAQSRGVRGARGAGGRNRHAGDRCGNRHVEYGAGLQRHREAGRQGVVT